MKRIVAGCTLLGLVLMQSMACSIQHANVNYDSFKKEMVLKTGGVQGESLGTVHGDEGGAIWVNCTESATESVHQMIAEAKTKGANAIGDIKWSATGTSDPGCKKGWGYFVIWPFILTPLFMSTAVDGHAVKMKGAKVGYYMLPNTPEEEANLVQEILARR